MILEYCWKSLSQVKMGILFLEATAQIKKSMCPPWIPFFLHSLENSAAKT
jgi:hypothetical protein